ncbi:peptidyl-prolyl cis-trans isomerase, cyclophilin-type [Opisthorchis viverrini]|uniref:Peptidyl-prolyl cis-trans isomerase n=1 Tax=Opisthorchis viverrini TaxID=6198 RepID=A0A1S8WK72_OPIVI|nr:peptidyl-prolyl cis-trans isomerase, cyclophilin-type [Opisthorchis viverrini]
MKVEIYGHMKKEPFQKALYCAQDLYEAHPKIFQKPEIHGLLEFDWTTYLFVKKRELGGRYWKYTSPVLVILNNEVLGSDEDFRKWAEENHSCYDYRPVALYTMLGNEAYVNALYERNRIFVSMLITIGGERCGPLLLELYSDILPKTCENFRALCTGEKGHVPKNEVESYKMHYKGTLFFRLVKNGWIQGGDVLHSRGNDGCSIYGRTFEDENFAIKHDRRGILSMANAGRHTNDSQFFITLTPTPWMDNLYVAFGRVIEGSLTLDLMEEVPTQNERPTKDICISEIRIMDPKDLSTKLC